MKLFEHFLPRPPGIMDMNMSMSAHAHMELSRKTPVVDHLEGYREFYEGLVEDILTHETVDLFAVGKSGIGKGAIIEQTFRKIEDDKRLRKTRRGGKSVTLQYYSLATEFQDAVSELGVVSPWGEFSPEELMEGAEKAAILGKKKLSHSEKEAPKPLFRGLDFVAVAVPIDFGASLVKDAAKREKEDPSYTYRIVAAKTDPSVQKKTIQLREALWALPPDAPQTAVEKVLQAHHLKPDTSDILLDTLRRGGGHPSGLKLANAVINQQIYSRQDEIRQTIDLGLPNIESPQALENDARLLDVAEDGYYRLLFSEWGVDASRALVVTNSFLSRQMPSYVRRLKQYRIR